MRYLVLCLLPLPAFAEDAPQKLPHAAPKAPDCYCTDKQRNRIELGESICLTVDGKSFIAQCQMSLNVPMWRKVRESCEVSAISKPTNPARHPG